MELEEAIEILDDFYKRYLHSLRPNEVNALKLGIEALKTFVDVRLFLDRLLKGLLPGETKD